MSSSGDNTLSSGLFPQWIKNKITDANFDMEDPSTFSPPTLDDSFFYLHLGRPNDKQKQLMEQKTSAPTVPAKKKSPQDSVDFSKHPQPCQLFVQQPDVPPQKVTIINDKKGLRIKSPGTDDGFKGDAAMCGTSIIQVANKMVQNGKTRSNFNSVAGSECSSIESLDTLDNTLRVNEPRTRRNSKSLPASPLSSPKLKRKTNLAATCNANKHRYFTENFADQNTRAIKSSWILSGLLGTDQALKKYDHISSSVHDLNVPDAAKIDFELEFAQNVSNVDMEENLTMPKFVKEKVGSAGPVMGGVHPKPTQLREINFLFPTSM